MAPYNGTSDEMKAVGGYLKDHGLFTFLRFGMIHTNPPLTITEEEMAEGFDIIDGALDLDVSGGLQVAGDRQIGRQDRRRGLRLGGRRCAVVGGGFARVHGILCLAVVGR